MKTRLLGLLASALVTASVALAADKEVTLTGMGQCAKCALGKSDTCQNTVTVKSNGKEELYFLAQNAVSKGFHENICTDSKQIRVTGTVKEVDGKKEITASKIEEVKG
jgi:predicted peroxiredoxin